MTYGIEPTHPVFRQYSFCGNERTRPPADLTTSSFQD